MKMVIFHSYVSLPEGNQSVNIPPKVYQHPFVAGEDSSFDDPNPSQIPSYFREQRGELGPYGTNFEPQGS